MKRNLSSSAGRGLAMGQMLLCALLWSIGGIFLKQVPYNAFAILFFRGMFAVMPCLFHLLHRRIRPVFSKKTLLHGLFQSYTGLAFVVANKLTTAANAIVLQYTAPVFVILLSLLFWRKKPDGLDLAACGIVLCGVACFFVDSLEMGGMAGNVTALLSGLCYAGVFLLNDLPETDPLSSVFWGDLFSAVIGLPFLLRETVFTPAALTGIFVLGVFQVGLAYVLMCTGLKTTPAVRAALISGIEPVLNPLLVAVFYREQVGLAALAGAVIVICGVVWYSVAKSRRNESISEKNHHQNH